MQYRIPALALLLALGAAACSPDEETTPDTPVIELFEARPDTLAPGETASLWWRTRLATAVRITDAAGATIDLEGKDPAAGSVEISPMGSTTYTLHAEGAGKTATAEVVVTVEGSPTVEHFAAVPAKITPGQSSTLTWRVKEAGHLRIETEDEVLVDTTADFSSNLEVQPDRTTTYTLTATFGDAETTATATLQVEPTIDSFDLEGTGPVAPGTEIPLTWTTRGAERLTLSNLETTVEITGDEVDAGSATLAVGETGTFRLVAHSGDLEAQQERTIEVMPLPVITSFDAPEQIVASAEAPATVTISWEAANASELTLAVAPSGETYELDELSGEMELAVSAATTLTLTAENAVGSVDRVHTIETLAPASILSFAADPEALLAGSPVTLSWEVENAANVSLTRDGETIAVEAGAASVVDQPEETAIYELTAFDALGGSTTAAVEVLVVEALIVATLEATPAAVATGDEVTLTWGVSPALPTWDVTVALVDDAGNTYDLSEASPLAGSIPVTMTEAGVRTFTLTATSMGATATAETTVTVALAPTIALTSTPEALTPSEASTEVELAWQTEDAASLEILQRLGDGTLRSLLVVPAAEVAAGSLTVETDGPITFVAQAASPEGVERSETLAVAYGEPTIVSFTADATEVAPGSTVTFTWETKHGVVEFGDLRSPTHEADLPFLDVEALGGSAIGFKDCGSECGELTFGFGFPYDGATHSTLWGHIHGFIAFDQPSAWDDYYFASYCVGQSTFYAQELAIAPYWGDFSTAGPESGLYAAESTDPLGRQFLVLEWRELESFWDYGIATFQAVLWEDGTFDFRYGPMVGDDVNGEYGAIGYLQWNPYDRENLFCEELVPGGLSGKAYRFFGPPPATGSTQITVDASGDHELCVRGFGGRKVCETLTITVTN